jgi:hypothetical protein
MKILDLCILLCNVTSNLEDVKLTTEKIRIHFPEEGIQLTTVGVSLTPRDGCEA